MALRQLRNEPAWADFLREAGIPNTESADYAKIFADNRMTEITARQLTTDHLEAIGITILGDVPAILNHVISLNPTVTSTVADNNSIANSHPVFRSPPAPTKRPSLTSDMTHPQYRKFLIDWKVYKTITGLPTAEIAPHVRSVIKTYLR